MNYTKLTTVFRRIPLPWINRNYKDSTFRLFFYDRKALLELYNAINQTAYTNPDALIINTLDNVIFLGMVNDLSFIIDTTLNIYEHQSTKCPNMPLRTLFYSAKLYAQIVDEKKLYSSKIQKIPEPHYVVFYNGLDELPEESTYRLSDMYEKSSEKPDLELTVHVININFGKNKYLTDSCEKLYAYSVFVSKIREYSSKMSTLKAVTRAIDYCIDNNILSDFFLKERKAITMVSLYEYDQASHMKLIKEESYQDGVEDGIKQGVEQGVEQGIKQGIEQGSAQTKSQIQKLFYILISENRVDDLQRACQDTAFLNKLLDEYNLNP